jgi:methyl-accepting chemotaxis protein
LEEVAHSIDGITQSAAAVRTLVEDVHAGSQEQVRGIEQIATALTNMGQLTQKTAASAEESAAASEQLSAQASAMKVSVHQLNGLVTGKG